MNFPGPATGESEVVWKTDSSMFAYRIEGYYVGAYNTLTKEVFILKGHEYMDGVMSDEWNAFHKKIENLLE